MLGVPSLGSHTVVWRRPVLSLSLLPPLFRRIPGYCWPSGLQEHFVGCDVVCGTEAWEGTRCPHGPRGLLAAHAQADTAPGAVLSQHEGQDLLPAAWGSEPFCFMKQRRAFLSIRATSTVPLSLCNHGFQLSALMCSLAVLAVLSVGPINSTKTSF